LPQLRAHLKAARDGGVAIVAGTDIGNPYRFPGYSFHEEFDIQLVGRYMTLREAGHRNGECREGSSATKINGGRSARVWPIS
jgi:hypothetical protein